MPPDIDQNAIALCLAREAGTGGAERHALMLLPRIVEHFAHVIDVAGDHDRFGEEAIRTGVGGVANKIDGPSEHAVGAEERDEIIAQAGGRSRRKRIRRPITLRCAGRRHDGDGPDIG